MLIIKLASTIENVSLIVQTMLNLNAKEEIGLQVLAMDALILILADLLNINMIRLELMNHIAII